MASRTLTLGRWWRRRNAEEAYYRAAQRRARLKLDLELAQRSGESGAELARELAETELEISRHAARARASLLSRLMTLW